MLKLVVLSPTKKCHLDFDGHKARFDILNNFIVDERCDSNFC